MSGTLEMVTGSLVSSVAEITSSASFFAPYLMQWGHGSSDNEKVASDIANYTHGTVELDLSTFKFDRTEMPQPRNNEKKQRRRKN